MEDSKKESKAKNFIKRYCNNKIGGNRFFHTGAYHTDRYHSSSVPSVFGS